jgi:hypothetical protein
MAVKNLKPGAGFASRGNLRSKGVDMTPVKIGDLNNQVIPQVNSELKLTNDTVKENGTNITSNTAAVAPLAGIAKGIFTTCAAAVSAGVVAGELYVLRQTYKVQEGEEAADRITDTIVLMGAECG